MKTVEKKCLAKYNSQLKKGLVHQMRKNINYKKSNK